jgi:hypothetical protein
MGKLRPLVATGVTRERETQLIKVLSAELRPTFCRTSLAVVEFLYKSKLIERDVTP